MKEADLYPPIKAFLETQGYEVKSEIGALDVMACRAGDPPVVVEMKTALNLPLILQGVARQALFEHVYLAVPRPPKWSHRYRDLTALLRRLGLGLMTVGADRVEVHLDPGPYLPRRNTARAGRLLREFQRRVGDPNTGGTTGTPRVTAYRQDALRLAMAIGTGSAAPAALAAATGVARAGAILRDNHYGWFCRIRRGAYGLTEAGLAVLAENPAPLPPLT